MRQLTIIAALAAGFVGLTSCQEATVNQTGSEYMPDMAHSIAYEANTYFMYYPNTWEKASVKSKYELAIPGTPVKGTVPRGYAGYFFANKEAEANNVSALKGAMDQVYGLDANNGIAVPLNGSVPYYYPDTEEGRLEATSEIRQNPFPITEDGLKRGKELYDIFCATCHGVEGDGNGYIYEIGTYPAAPRNFLVEEWVDTTAGHFYHAIMYGKNVMGSYKGKVSYEERWQIIHHIRALQAKAFEKEYTPEVNTLVPAEAEPIAGHPQYAAFLESFTREPMEYEAQESDAPHTPLPEPEPSTFIDTDSIRQIEKLRDFNSAETERFDDDYEENH